MNRAEFKDWKSSPITKAVFTQISQRIYGLQTELGISAGVDPRQDAIKVGAIQAYEDILDIDFDEDQS